MLEIFEEFAGTLLAIGFFGYLFGKLMKLTDTVIMALIIVVIAKMIGF